MANLYADLGPRLDAARITELARLLGHERFGELIDILDERLKQVMIRLEDGVGCNELVDAVHQSGGSASSLGFPRLAGWLGQLELLMTEAVIEFNKRKMVCCVRQAEIFTNMGNIISELREARSGAIQSIE